MILDKSYGNRGKNGKHVGFSGSAHPVIPIVCLTLGRYSVSKDGVVKIHMAVL